MGKGARLKQERRKERELMETGQAMYERVDAMVNDLENMPDVPYFSCSFDDHHDETCKEIATDTLMVPGQHINTMRVFGEDADIPCVEMNKMEVAIFHEKKRWEIAGMTPDAVTYSPIQFDARITALVQTLEEILGVTREQIDRIFRDQYFKILKETRETLQPSVQEQRRESLVARHMPSIVGPNGKPLIH